MHNRFTIRQIFLAVIINVIAVGTLCYLDGQTGVTVIPEAGLYAKLEQRIIQPLSKESHELPDSILFIDLAYDQQLVPAVNEMGDTVGVTQITNRGSLYRFFRLANMYDNYKKILLDVRFEKGDDTEYDSLLFRELGRTRRLVMPYHRDIQEVRIPNVRYGYSDFSTLYYASEFSKYEYVQEGMPSIASEFAGTEIRRYGGLLTFCKGALAYNDLPIVFRYNPNRCASSDSWAYKLGADILMDSLLLGEMIKDRYVVIGNTVTDTHSTYAGGMPGAVINLNASLALDHGDNRVHWWYASIWALLYAVLTILTMCDISLVSLIPFARKVKSDILVFALSFIQFSSLITLVATVIFIKDDYMSSITIPASYFSLFSIFVEYKKSKQQ